jgi:hypothetical protein
VTTLVCRLGTRHRVLIRTRQDSYARLYLGTLVDNTGRPARRRSHGKPVRGQANRDFTTAPVRAGVVTATGLCELLMILDSDAELFA